MLLFLVNAYSSYDISEEIIEKKKLRKFLIDISNFYSKENML